MADTLTLSKYVAVGILHSVRIKVKYVLNASCNIEKAGSSKTMKTSCFSVMKIQADSIDHGYTTFT